MKRRKRSPAFEYRKFYCLLTMMVVLSALRIAEAQPGGIENPVPRLPPFGEVERELGGREQHRFSVAVEKKGVLAIRAHQESIDIRLALLDSAGKRLAETDRNKQDSELLVWDSAAGGIYILEVRSNAPEGTRGRYRISWGTTDLLNSKDQDSEAVALMAEGASALQQGSADALRIAQTRFEAAQPLFAALGKRREEGLCAAALGSIAEKLGDRTQATQLFNKALGNFRTAGNDSGVAQMLDRIAQLKAGGGDDRAAITLFDEALRLRRKIKDSAGEAVTLVNLGASQQSLGNVSEAKELFTQAQKLFISLGDKKGQAAVEGHLGSILSGLGNKGEAIEFYNRSLSYYVANGDTADEAGVLGALGIVYSQLGDEQKALAHFERAFQLARTSGDKTKIAKISHDIGRSYQELGNHARALQYFEQALDLRQQLGDKRGQAATLVALSATYALTRQPKSALPPLNKALEIFREIGDRRAESVTLNDAAVLHMTLNDITLAFNDYKGSIVLARSVGDRRVEAEALHGVSLVYFSQGNLPAGTFFGKAAMIQLQDLRTDVRTVDKNLQQSYLKTFAEYYRIVSAFLCVQKRLGEALQIMNLFKDQEYFDSGSLEALPAVTLTAAENELARRLALATDAFSNVLAKRSSEAAKANPPNSRTSAEADAYDAAFDAVAKGFPDAAAARVDPGQIPDLSGLQATLRDIASTTKAPAVAVSTILFRQNILTIVVTENSTELATSRVDFDMDTKVQQLSYLLRSPKYDPRSLSKEIYDSVFSQIVSKIPPSTQTILWSLDGTLRQLPVSALYDGNQYLVERFDNVVITRFKQERMTRSASEKKTGVGFGVTLEHTTNLNGKRYRIPALPNVRKELNRIFGGAKGLPLVDGEVLTDRVFTKARMLAELRRPKPIVHIASHFSLEPGDESRSFLLLGDGNLLTLSELRSERNLFRGVDLLTLSACQTAVQRPDGSGREVDGFAELAQRQGAGAVLASLWDVSDQSTSELMGEFYKGYISSRQTKARALKTAQLALLKGNYSTKAVFDDAAQKKLDIELGNAKMDSAELALYRGPAGKPFSHPYYWSPFILIGNVK